MLERYGIRDAEEVGGPGAPFITEVEILPVRPQNGLVAFASCIVNRQIYLGNIGVHRRRGDAGFRLVFPTKLLPNGRSIPVFYPISRHAGDTLLFAISDKLGGIHAVELPDPHLTGGRMYSGGSDERA